MKEEHESPLYADEHYVVRTFEGMTPKKEAYTETLIALEKNGIVTSFTGLEKAARVFSRSNIRHISASNRTPIIFDVQFLNHLVVNYGMDPREAPFNFDKEDLQEFFEAYAQTGTRTDSTIKQCICSVTSFAAGLTKMYPGVLPFKADDLYEDRIFHYYERTEKGKVPNFEVNTLGREGEPFRELPLKVLPAMISYAFRKAPDIAFAICLQTFAGLREGEVMSVRQENSRLGPGLKITTVKSALESVEIDITGDYCLRADGTRTGSIKRNRTAEVFPAFLGAFDAAYKLHLEYLEGRTYDREIAPMFIDVNGNAMTVKTYRRRVQAMVEGFRKEVLSCSPDPELKTYGLLLREYPFVPHIYRHIFTVMLVLMDQSPATVQFYRGDRSAESSLHYLSRKDDLRNRYKAAQSELVRMFLEAVNKKGNENNG